jgi:recombinase
MKRVNGGVSSSERGHAEARPNQPVADSFALNVLPTLQKLMAAGFVSQRALANELNRRRIPTARGGSWHRTSIGRVLARLGLARDGNNGLALKKAADVRAEALSQTIHKLRKAGLSAKAIARELNARKIATALGGKWHTTSVYRLLQRLGNLEREWRALKRAER